MQETRTQFITIIIAVIIILLIIGVFILVMLTYYNNKKRNSIRENQLLKKEFEQKLLQTQLEVQEEVMRFISQEIHDNVTHTLGMALLNINTLKEYDIDKLRASATLINKAVVDIRSLSRSLNPEKAEEVGLIQVIKNELSELERTGLYTTSFKVEDDINLPGTKLIIIHRMIQEVLNNIIKHSGANSIEAYISNKKIMILDNGKGFLEERIRNGLGLQHLHQRAAVVGATIDIKSEMGKGTIVTFNFNNTLE
jgi:signal transduction histidine kinase